MFRTAPRLAWLTLAVSSAAVATLTVILTDRLGLDPCYLCVFQRLLFFIMAAAALIAAMLVRARTVGLAAQAIFLMTALSGSAAASYQSWLQMQPLGTTTCVSGNSGLIEQLVEWLGQQWPTLFLATGFCEDTGMTIASLSLANWALICFAISFGAGTWVSWQSTHAKNRIKI